MTLTSPSEDRVTPATAVITMGGQAQVVTFCLDALLATGTPVETVLVVHFSAESPRVLHALRQLNAAFAGGRYGERPMAYRRLPVAAGADGALPYVRTDREAEIVWTWARDLLGELKAAGRRLHLCVAGGPRMLALTLTSAALLQCDHGDRLWHLYTPRDFRAQAQEGQILHAPPEAGVRLIPVPMAPLGSYFPVLRELAGPAPALGPRLDPQDAARCQAVWAQLTPRQREVLTALAEGQLPQEAADALYITLKTLDTHKTQILAECRVAWDHPDDAHLTYHFLRETFGPWLALRQAAQARRTAS